MSIKRIKKALGLLLVDTAIIIGIIVLQFRTDSSIIEKIGNLQITMEKAETDTTEVILQNVLMLSYNGINISIDEKHPAMVKKVDSDSPEQVSLVSYEKGDLFFKFNFTENVNLKVSLESTEPASPLDRKVFNAANRESFDLPYSISQTMNIQKEERKSIVLDNKKNSWEFKLPSSANNIISFNQHEISASYSIFDDTKQFNFDNIHELAIADSFVFQKTVEDFTNNLISKFESTVTETSYTEQNVISYVAAMASKGKYQEAIDKVPQSFKKSSIRTYRSAPYFNTLEEMNANLEEDIQENTKQIISYKTNPSLNLYTIKNVATNLWLFPDVATVRNMLIKASESDISLASIAQVTGLLNTYIDLNSYRSGYAKYLEPILELCVQKIMNSCDFEGELLTISENDSYLSVNNAVESGIALLKYGILTENNTLQMAGRALVNSYISDSTSFDLRTLANIYPTIAFDNKYYPHFEKVFTDNGTTVWAWTCAKEITFKSDTSSSCVINIDFPETWTHYVILKGIPSFDKIYIYDIPFRTDPRFETYNSSGYVYKFATDTLLLKSRHKSNPETIRLVFSSVEETLTNESDVPIDEVATTDSELSTDTTDLDTTNNTETEIDSENN